MSAEWGGLIFYHMIKDVCCHHALDVFCLSLSYEYNYCISLHYSISPTSGDIKTRAMEATDKRERKSHGGH